MVVSGIFVILAVWLIVGKRHLANLDELMEEKWLLLDECLKKRQDLVPNLVETLRKYNFDNELVKELISLRYRTATNKERGAGKIGMENEFSAKLKEILQKSAGDRNIDQDTNYLELKKNLKDIYNLLEEKNQTYNEMVRSYNRQVSAWFLAPISAIYRVEKKNIFEIE